MQMDLQQQGGGIGCEDYHELHDKLKHKPEFLFEEAQCLSKTGTTRRSDTGIGTGEAAERRPDDPVHDRKNRQTLEITGEAEEELLQATGILPRDCIHIIC